MTTEGWQRLWALFHEALERPADDRQAYLDAACGDDEALRAELGALLRAHDDSEGFLEPAVPTTTADASLVGQCIDTFRIEALIGQGGMGSVFLASDLSSLRRPVALKLIRRGMDSDRIVARFQYERQALASMQHPHIASAFAAGTSADGRSYFVMELVRGVPIDRYAAEHALDTDARLQLFAQLCSAVAHAHQRGVIHRDLKPSNVLVADVDGQPQLKVIDFGIAKAVDAQPDETGLSTETGLLVGTPVYMSPEQASGGRLPVDTRTDVYALGVLLYQLMVGALPFDTTSLRGDALDIQRAIRDADPPTPSEHARKLSARASGDRAARAPAGAAWRDLRGGLDWIILKAIAKEPDRRYATVAALMDDIERQRRHQPLLAAPPGSLYRLNRFLRRHRLGSAVAGALLLSAGVFSVGLWQQMRTTEAALQRAELERARAQRVTAFLIDVFEVSDPAQSLGRDLTARAVLDEGAKRLRDGLDDDPETRATLMDTIAEVYRRLGLFEEGLALQEDALSLWREQAPAGSPATAAALSRMASLHRELGRYEQAEAAQRQALAMRIAIHGAMHAEVARARTSLGLILRARGERDAALEELELALALQSRPDVPVEPADRAALLNALAGVEQDRGNHQAAEQHYRNVLRLRLQYASNDPLLLANARNNLGSVLIRKGDYAAAESEFLYTAGVYRAVLGDHHPDTATALNNLAVSINQQGRAEEALPHLQEALAIRIATLGAEHPEVAVARYNIGRTMMNLDRPGDALDLYRLVRPVFVSVHGAQHPRMAILLNAMAHAELATHDLAAADADATAAREIAAARWPDGHEVLADSLALLSEIALREGDAQRALGLARSALDMAQARLGDRDWRVAMARLVLGEALHAQGRADDARPLANDALDTLAEQFGSANPRARRAARLQAALSQP